MRVFITGGAGFLGSWLVEYFVDNGHTVVSVDNLVGGSQENVVQSRSHVFHVADILDFDLLSGLVVGCDVVFHTAALAHEGLSVYSPNLIMRNIYSGTVSVMTAAIGAGVRRFVNCSSIARYGNGVTPFQEFQQTNPVDPYGQAKVAAEQALTLLGRIHNVEVVHAVPHNIIGPRQKYNDPFRNVVGIMANRMLQQKQPIIFGDGSQQRCFSHITDVLCTLVRLAECELECGGEVFNVGPDEEPISIHALAMLVADFLDFKLDPIFLPARRCEVDVAICSADKIRERLDYQTRVSLVDSVSQTVDYVRQRGPREFEYHLPIELPTDSVPAMWLEHSV